MLYTKDDPQGTPVTTPVATTSSSSSSTTKGSTTTTSNIGNTSSSSSSSSSSTTNTPKSPVVNRKLTARCAHGPKGACQHCDPVTQSDINALKAGPLNKAGGRHAERSTKMDELSGDLEWLCRHRPDAMCINCAPLKKGEKVELEMLCLHGPEGRCINCLPPDSTVDDRKFLTFDEWLEKRRAKCEHSFSATCVNCVSPSQISYKLKPNCPKHRPWPDGLCSDCAPQPVEAKLQEYRHVDYISIMNMDEMGNLIKLFSANEAAGVHRAAYLYGTVVPDNNYRFGQRVCVEAMYEPPQKVDARFGLVLLPDKRANEVEAIANACGIKRVGWVFTKPPKKTPEESELSPRELWAMAHLQNAHPRSEGKPGSQFVTIVIRKGPDGYEPKAYMASDAMMALARDGVLADPNPNDTVMKMKQPRPNTNDPPAPEFITTSKDWGRKRGFEMDTDAGIVTLAVGGAPSGTTSKFRHVNFPIENRTDYGITQAPVNVKQQLLSFRSESLNNRLSDFHLLLYLITLFDVKTAVLTATAIMENKSIPEGVVLMLDDITGGAASSK